MHPKKNLREKKMRGPRRSFAVFAKMQPLMLRKVRPFHTFPPSRELSGFASAHGARGIMRHGSMSPTRGSLVPCAATLFCRQLTTPKTDLTHAMPRVAGALQWQVSGPALSLVLASAFMAPARAFHVPVALRPVNSTPPACRNVCMCTCGCARACAHESGHEKREGHVAPSSLGRVSAHAGCTCHDCLRSHPWWAARWCATWWTAVALPRLLSMCHHASTTTVRVLAVGPTAPRVETFGKACTFRNSRTGIKIHFYH